MKPSPWEYQWTQVCDRLHVYFRHRLEPTIDNFGKPFTEVLAYVIQEDGGWDWHAYRHVADKIEEMDTISDLSLPMVTTVKELVESIIEHELLKLTDEEFEQIRNKLDLPAKWQDPK